MNAVKFSSLTAEAKYHILNYLSENRDAPHSCFEITQAVQQQNEAIRETIISGALHTLRNSGRIIKLNIPFTKCTLFADQVHPFR